MEGKIITNDVSIPLNKMEEFFNVIKKLKMNSKINHTSFWSYWGYATFTII